MTKQDLQLLYRQETGKDVPKRDWLYLDASLSEKKEVEEFIEWLEEKLLNLYNL